MFWGFFAVLITDMQKKEKAHQMGLLTRRGSGFGESTLF